MMKNSREESGTGAHRLKKRVYYAQMVIVTTTQSTTGVPFLDSATVHASQTRLFRSKKEM